MTKTLSMVSHKNYNLGANEGFVIFLTSKIITNFIDGFTLKMESHAIAYLLNGSEHINRILDLEGEVHSICDLWISDLQECEGNGFFEVGRADKNFRSGPENMDFFMGATPAQIYLPQKVCKGRFNVRQYLIACVTNVTEGPISNYPPPQLPPILICRGP